MKKSLPVFALLICLTALFGPRATAQCTPDTTLTAVGWYPNPLPNGCVGQAYNQTVQFVFPNDTTLPLVGTVPFDSFKVNSITNVPTGLSYTCNVASCIYVTAPPAITRGCVVISGTPTAPNAAPNDSVSIAATAYAAGFGIPVALKIGLHIDSVCGVAVNPNIAQSLGLTLAPNPAGSWTRLSFSLSKTQAVSIQVLDASGREVRMLQNGSLNAGLHQVDLSLGSEIPAGLYHIRFTMPESDYSQTVKMVKF